MVVEKNVLKKLLVYIYIIKSEKYLNSNFQGVFLLIECETKRNKVCLICLFFFIAIFLLRIHQHSDLSKTKLPSC